MSSRAWVVDLIESIGEKIALCSHIEEKLRYSEDEAEKAGLEKLLQKVLALRREQMNYLLEQAENPDPTYWCQFKHSVGAWERDVEVYEATKDSADLERLKKSSDILAMSVSLFLGMEFEECARCLADKLLVEQYDRVTKTQSAILNSNDKGDK